MKKTSLYDLHCELNARMVPFAGYEMPVQYPTGIKHEHTHCRTHAGLFDISHMGQIKMQGTQAISLLESLIPTKLSDMNIGQQRYSVFINDAGGILDDIMITKMSNHLILVVNAACKDADVKYLQSKVGEYRHEDCQMDYLQNKALLAIQGPEAANVLETFLPEVNQLNFMQGDYFDIQNIPCMVNRCGYTGEDGFEISVDADNAEKLARLLLSDERVMPIGLGARDTLRLEAGLCLYGHDIDENTSPVEANISWIINDKELSHAFPGIDIIKQQIKSGVERKRIGLIKEDKVPLREGMSVLNAQGEVVGNITSGGFSPTLGKPIAMAYINTEFAETGNKLQVHIRDKIYEVETITLPFVKHRYYRKNHS